MRGIAYLRLCGRATALSALDQVQRALSSVLLEVASTCVAVELPIGFAPGLLICFLAVLVCTALAVLLEHLTRADRSQST